MALWLMICALNQTHARLVAQGVFVSKTLMESVAIVTRVQKYVNKVIVKTPLVYQIKLVCVRQLAAVAIVQIIDFIKLLLTRSTKHH
jgi:hypothetical protein